nr:AEC family transporter [Caulobacter sp. RHG1]
MFGVALIIVESGLQSEARPHQVAFKVIGNLARNPLLIAPVFGLAWSAAGLTLGGPLETFVRLLAGSTTPCALVALGLFLAIRRDVPGAKAPPIAFTALKLVGQPALTGLAAIALGLPHALMAIAVVIAALPTGTGPFMVAEYYGREAVVTSKTILMTTALSAVTVTILICFLHIG